MLVLGLRLKSQAQHSWFGQDVENLLLSSQLSQSGELYVSTLYLYHLHSGDIVIPAEITFLPSLHSFQSVPLARSLVVKMMTLSSPTRVRWTLVPSGFIDSSGGSGPWAEPSSLEALRWAGLQDTEASLARKRHHIQIYEGEKGEDWMTFCLCLNPLRRTTTTA